MSSFFDLGRSFERARERLGSPENASARRERSDRGLARLDPEVVEEVGRLAGGQDRPRMTTILAEVGRTCGRRGLKPPSRSALYRLLDRLPGHTYLAAGLPEDARSTLYNLDDRALVPGAQLAFHCFNYGNCRALSFAAGLPWLDLYQARRKRGWRPKSRGLFEAICRARGI